MESLYTSARDAGVVIIKYDSPPAVNQQDGRKVVVTCYEQTVGVRVAEEFDLLINADAVSADGGNKLLTMVKHLKAGPDGQLQYDNIWLLPTEANRKGIFVAGSARGDGELRDAQADGLAAAESIGELLKNKSIEVFDDEASVDSDKCVLCLTCLRVCPHGAISIDDDSKKIAVSALTCRRCGICAAHCPAKAIELPGYTDNEMDTEVGDKPVVTVFACENSALPAATAAGINGMGYDADVRLIRVPCAGKVEPRQILRALESGAKKVMVLGCHPEACKYLTGSSYADRRAGRIVELLERAGFDGGRVCFGGLSAVEPNKFIEYVKECQTDDSKNN